MRASEKMPADEFHLIRDGVELLEAAGIDKTMDERVVHVHALGPIRGGPIEGTEVISNVTNDGR
ncbi:hypothetical protein K227x_13440 [Rubripirellula lacrimiformis]|uniref:Uncharacterized protein n=1 Tax=Rubripirellula lacrimiformis TaxID=1930273 RepID=A0A517N762_9BACT|nr:hypothetical protein K227x_13440 [Rubripirellula lacrimiformis]